MHGVWYIFNFLRTQVFQGYIEFTRDLIGDRPRNKNAAGIGQGFDPRRHIHAIPKYGAKREFW